MTTLEAIVAVLVAAIFANIVLAVGLIIGPRIRGRRDVSADPVPPQVARTGPGVGPVGVGPGRPIQGGPGSPFSTRPAPSDTATAGAAFGPAGSSAFEPGKPAATDPVTGFELAPAWSKWLAEEGARFDRYGRPSTIVIVELSGLDRLAERLGPEAADRLMPPIASTLRRHSRASDSLARLGRTRIGALLTETDEIRAINYVERARSECDVWLESGAVALRLSIGWAEIGANQPVEVAIQAAERRLNEERQRLRMSPDPELDPEPDPEPYPEPDADPDADPDGPGES